MSSFKNLVLLPLRSLNARCKRLVVGFEEDENTTTSPYMGVSLSGDGWVISTNLSDGMVNVEEAKYSWSINDNVSMTFGSQAEPYGLAWGLHRPSNNWFVSTPRDLAIDSDISTIIASTRTCGLLISS